MPEVVEVEISYLSIITSRFKGAFHAVIGFTVLLMENEPVAVYVAQGKLFKLRPKSVIDRYFPPFSVNRRAIMTHFWG